MNSLLSARAYTEAVTVYSMSDNRLGISTDQYDHTPHDATTHSYLQFPRSCPRPGCLGVVGVACGEASVDGSSDHHVLLLLLHGGQLGKNDKVCFLGIDDVITYNVLCMQSVRKFGRLFQLTKQHRIWNS